MSYLKLVEQATHRVVETREPVVRFGRDPASTVVFTGEAVTVVSARHAEIRHVAGEWRLVDLASRNGTFLNGRRVTAETPLKRGDVVRLGGQGDGCDVLAGERDDVEPLRDLVGDDEPAVCRLDVVGGPAQLDEARLTVPDDQQLRGAVQRSGDGAVVGDDDVVRAARGGVPLDDRAGVQVDERELVAVLDRDPGASSDRLRLRGGLLRWFGRWFRLEFGLGRGRSAPAPRDHALA